jgi:NAD+-dependent protein deacetylase sirtuin 4
MVLATEARDTVTAAHVAIEHALRFGGVIALTGAGMSTDSGIPDYRSPAAMARVRRPIQGPDFLRSASVRRRYWARAIIGWEHFRRAQPCAAHVALADLEAGGAVDGIITQNVDRLHQVAGSRRVIELHGALAEVACVDCGDLVTRDDMQARMRSANPSWIDGPTPMAPDGDADLPDDLVADFRVPPCASCGGVLKPKVVFFGESVAPEIVGEAYRLLDQARALLVLGTSLAVFSGYRFLRRAVQRPIPIFVVNRGPVRGEEHARAKIDASLGPTLEGLARHSWVERRTSLSTTRTGTLPTK